MLRSSPLKAFVTTVLFWTAEMSLKPCFWRARIVPSSCQGVVLAAGKG